MADNLVLGRGKLYFTPYAPGTTTGGVRGYLGNTPSFTMTQAITKLDHYSSEGGLKVKDKSVTLQTDVTLAFETDHISVANMLLWFGGNNSDALPSDAPGDLGTVTIIGAADQIYGALTFESDNPVGDNVNYWFPYVSLGPTGSMALKGDAWQALSFTCEALKRDNATERLYTFQPATPAGSASTDSTPELTANAASVATGGSLDPATGATVTAPATASVNKAIHAVFTLTGGDLHAYAVLHTGSVNEGAVMSISGAFGLVSLTPLTEASYTIKITSDSAGVTALATSGAITVGA